MYMTYKLFNIITGEYIKAFHKYIVYDTETADYDEEYYLICNLSRVKGKSITEIKTLAHYWIYERPFNCFVLKDINFLHVKELNDFISKWLNKEGFFGGYKENEFNDGPDSYANPDGFFVSSAYEIHIFDGYDKLIGVKDLCDFSPSKV